MPARQTHMVLNPLPSAARTNKESCMFKGALTAAHGALQASDADRTMQALARETALKMRLAAARTQRAVARATARPLYLSYRANEARPQALALREALEARGLLAFMREVDVPDGADVAATCYKALEQCVLVVVLASAAYGARSGKEEGIST